MSDDTLITAPNEKWILTANNYAQLIISEDDKKLTEKNNQSINNKYTNIYSVAMFPSEPRPDIEEFDLA